MRPAPSLLRRKRCVENFGNGGLSRPGYSTPLTQTPAHNAITINQGRVGKNSGVMSVSPHGGPVLTSGTGTFGAVIALTWRPARSKGRSPTLFSSRWT